MLFKTFFVVQVLTIFLGRVALEKMPANVHLQLGVVFELRAVCLHEKGD